MMMLFLQRFQCFQNFNTWYDGGPTPYDMSLAAGATDFNDFESGIICGGLIDVNGTKTATNMCHKYYGGNGKLVQIPSLLKPRFGHSMINVEGEFFSVETIRKIRKRYITTFQLECSRLVVSLWTQTALLSMCLKLNRMIRKLAGT